MKVLHLQAKDNGATVSTGIYSKYLQQGTETQNNDILKTETIIPKQTIWRTLEIT